MEEKRKSKRFDIDVEVESERIDPGAKGSDHRFVLVDVTDISMTGIAFISNEDFDIGATFAAKIKIWSGKTLDSVFKVIRKEKKAVGFKYGCIFVGMKENDALSIKIYELLHDQEAK
jgi:hypothetical protein